MFNMPRTSAIQRWHFYAGLVCLPFLILMAMTGGAYLFKNEINTLIYRPLFYVQSSSNSESLRAEQLINSALYVVPGRATQYIEPEALGRTAEVQILTVAGEKKSVYLDPQSGKVLGTLEDKWKLMEVIKNLHSLELVGKISNQWIEVVASWAIFLVVSGVFLYFPRFQQKGGYKIQGHPKQRTWWRDLHTTVGLTASVVILFLAITGMPWSAFWGQQFSSLTNKFGIGLPKYLWSESPESSIPMQSLGSVPWTLTNTVLPKSTGHHANHDSEISQTRDKFGNSFHPIGINKALEIYKNLNIPKGTPVNLPMEASGVYTAISFPDDVRLERVVHIDQYTGAVLADIKYDDFGIAGRITEWGVSLHTGRQFGLVNKLVMLFGCLAIIALAFSALVMWWKRRPVGRFGAPSNSQGKPIGFGVLIVILTLSVIYPLLGLTFLLSVIFNCLLPKNLKTKFGL